MAITGEEARAYSEFALADLLNDDGSGQTAPADGGEALGGQLLSSGLAGGGVPSFAGSSSASSESGDQDVSLSGDRRAGGGTFTFGTASGDIASRIAWAGFAVAAVVVGYVAWKATGKGGR